MNCSNCVPHTVSGSHPTDNVELNEHTLYVGGRCLYISSFLTVFENYFLMMKIYGMEWNGSRIDNHIICMLCSYIILLNFVYIYLIQ